MKNSAPQESPMADDEIAYHKKITAIHEAGHGIAAVRLGAKKVTLRLLRDHDADLTTTTPFEGGCRTFGLKGKLKVASLGYAGALAEMLYDTLYTHEEDAWQDIKSSPHWLSYSDRELLAGHFDQGGQAAGGEISRRVCGSIGRTMHH